jgi:hypothetical protein
VTFFSPGSLDNLPKQQVTFEGSMKKVVSYELTDEEKIKKVGFASIPIPQSLHTHAHAMQVTRVFRIEKKRVPKPVATRKQWKKFGDASRDVEGPDPATTKIADDVFLTLTTNSSVSHLCLHELGVSS